MAELTCHQRIGSLVNRTLDLKPRGNCPSRPLSMVSSSVAAWCTSLENDNGNAQAYCGNAQCQSIYLGEFNAFHFGGLRLPWLSGASYVPFNGTETLWYSAVLHSKGMDSCCRALRLSPSVREARSTAAGNLRSRAAYELPHLHRWQLTLLERRQLSYSVSFVPATPFQSSRENNGHCAPFPTPRAIALGVHWVISVLFLVAGRVVRILFTVGQHPRCCRIHTWAR